MKKRLFAFVVGLLLALSSQGAKYPSVSSSGDVVVNKWTSQVTKAFAAAKANNVPLLITFVNHKSDGSGCGHCATWVKRCVSTSRFTSFLKTHPAILVMVNKATESKFSDYYWKYLGNANGSYPGMAIYSAAGKKLNSLNENKSLWNKTYKDADLFFAWLAKYIPEVPQSSTVSLSEETAAVTAGEAYSGTITYTSGGGDVEVQLSSDDTEGVFDETSFSLPAASGAGSVDFTFTSSLTPALMASASLTLTLVSGDASLATQSLTLTVKNANVKQTLDEYAEEQGLDTLAAEAGEWYLDQEDNLRSAPVESGSTAALSYTATESGILTVGNVSVSGDGTLVVAIDGAETQADAASGMTIGLTEGETVVFTGTSGADETWFNLGSLSFTAYTPTALTSPEDGAAIQLPDLQEDLSLVDLAWSAIEGASTYVVKMGATQDGVESVYEGEFSEEQNAFDLGVVVTNTPQGVLYATVDAIIPATTFDYASGDVTVSGETTTFSIVANPVFPEDAVRSVTAYLKAAVSISFAASSLSTVTYSASGLPAGLKINSSNGTLYGTPTKTGTYNVGIRATNASGTTTHNVTIAVKAAANLKTKCTGLVFNANGRTLVGTIALNVASSGKATAKLVLPSKVNVKGTVSVKADGFSFNQGSLALTRASSGVWIGTYKSYRVVARTAGSGNTGTYTAALVNNSTIRGYATATVKAKGKVKTVCKLPDTKQASISATGINLTADQASQAGIYYPEGVSGTALYFPVFKNASSAKLAGIGIVCSGRFVIPTATWKGAYSSSLEASGRKYTASLGGFAGKTFQVAGRSGNVVASFPLTASKSSVSAGSNKVSAKVKAKSKTGLFNASVRISKKKVNLKGAFVPADVVAGAVGKSGKTYYYGGIEVPAAAEETVVDEPVDE